MSRNRTFGAISGPSGIVKKLVIANFNLTPEWDVASVDSSLGALQVGLPQPSDQYPPSDGEIYTVLDSGGQAATNNITIASPGIPILLPAVGEAASASIATNGGALTFFYDKNKNVYVLSGTNGASSGNSSQKTSVYQAVGLAGTFAFEEMSNSPVAKASVITDLQIPIGQTAFAAGESVSIDIRKNGVSILSAPIVLDSTSGSSVVLDKLSDVATTAVAAASDLQAFGNYTPGGTPNRPTFSIVLTLN